MEIFVMALTVLLALGAFVVSILNWSDIRAMDKRLTMVEERHEVKDKEAFAQTEVKTQVADQIAIAGEQLVETVLNAIEEDK